MIAPGLRPITLLTGASAGIGAALAQVFAEHRHELVLVARREARLRQLADDLAAQGFPRPLVVPADLERPEAGAQIAAALERLGVEPAIVVNNAAFGLVGEAEDLDREEQLRMIDLNVRALTDLSLRWIASLERHRGGILNVASVAAFLPGPRSAVYYASKAYVLSFSEALHQELAPRGVRVTALCPGPVATEFQARAGVPDARISGRLGRSAAEVARQGYRGFTEGHRVVVPGFANRMVTVLSRLLPRRCVLAIMDRRQKRRRGP
ncbi:MAG TPA: SDR family oxidoreductase [Xanthobacteraceae bacterium]|nr:SDR family oxidoreductase [Xanthobacteraceae bacterium]